MIQQEFCQNCRKKHDCQEVYRRLGNAACPSILLKTIIAFLLPLVVFIVSLAVLDKIFAATGGDVLSFSHGNDATNAQKMQTVVSLLIALLITSICVLITRVISKRYG
jgi:ABC-type spermidine/putrescine transport system permease subunit I